ncbi:DUF2516 family protein [Nocardioides mesophilus]|nr:DUF2516 family protein [Nocardioides mesophilus]
MLFGLQSFLLLALTLALLALQAWAFIDALSHRREAYVAADKQSKNLWLIILGVALAAHIVLLSAPFHIVNLLGAVVAIVYLVDARPALRSLTRR